MESTSDDMTEILPAPASCQTLVDYAAAAACPGDDDDLKVVRNFLRGEAELRNLQSKLADIMVGREGDPRFIVRCHDAFKARCELEAIERETMLREWWPGLLRQDFPN